VKQFVGKIVCGSALLALAAFAAPASAQEVPALDLGVGYQWLHAPDQGYPLGFNLDLSGTLNGTFRWVGEFNYSRDSESESGVDASLGATAFGGGVRWAPEAGARYRPYAQVLLGAHRDSFSIDSSVLALTVDEDEWSFMLQPGVGATFPVGDRWGLFGQGDWRRIFYEGEGQNNFRVVVGARLTLR
jgi:hypothetical protein